jgi:crossover junction endodeoxyribonuclease RuvC
MNIVAFDLSLTATGYASSAGAVGVLSPPKTIAGGIRRLQWIRFQVLQLSAAADLVVLEGYAYGAKGRAVVNIGELGGVIRVALADRARAFVEVPPANLKLFATGKGNAPKDDVFGAAIRKLKYAGNNHNEADALWLLEMARARYHELWDGNEAQHRALSKITWPTITPSPEAHHAE